MACGGYGNKSMGFLEIEPAQAIVTEGGDPISFTFSAFTCQLGHWAPEDYRDFSFFMEPESLGTHNSDHTEILEEFRGFSY